MSMPRQTDQSKKEMAHTLYVHGVQQRSYAEVAKVVKVNDTTIERWSKQDPIPWPEQRELMHNTSVRQYHNISLSLARIDKRLAAIEQEEVDAEASEFHAVRTKTIRELTAAQKDKATMLKQLETQVTAGDIMLVLDRFTAYLEKLEVPDDKRRWLSEVGLEYVAFMKQQNG